jgi:hypothetical protein
MSGYFDTYRGVVLDTNDPLDQRRLLVQVPELALEPSAWAVPEHADGVDPSVGDLVSVRYENGDESYPIWSSELATPGAGSGHGRYLGTYQGLVIDDVDPGGYERLLVQAPDLGPDAMWAVPAQPGARTPAVGEAVWIRFDGGDAERPLWSA